MNYPNARIARQSGRPDATGRPGFTTNPTRRPPNASLDLLEDRELMRGLSDTPLRRFTRPGDHSVATLPDVEITNFRCIGSYNWVRADVPTILVPGAPPRWRELQLPFSVPPDEGVHIIDQWCPSDLLLVPLVQSVNRCAELTNAAPFDWASVDLVVDRAVLRKLLRWANHSEIGTNTNNQYQRGGVRGSAQNRSLVQNGMRESDANFRVDLQLGGSNTVLMNRVPIKITEHVNPGFSYRFTFEQAALEPLEGCREYSRILSYDMNGMKMVVRFEADAYVANNTADEEVETSDEIDSLITAMGSTTIAGNGNRADREAPRRTSVECGIEMRYGGGMIPDSSIIELTTRSIKNTRNDWPELYCQMFLSQTANHFTAKHDRGTYRVINRRSMLDEGLRRGEIEAQVRLKKLLFVLNAIRQAVVDAGRHGRLSLVSVNGNLGMYQRNEGGDIAPEAILQAFE